MNMKRRAALAIGALVAPLLAVSLPASTASAHGWVTSPASRQDQCANGVVDCGAQFAELDNDSKGWRVTPVARTYTFNWHHTARHATANWQYFIGNTKIAEFSGHGAQPPADVSHQVDFGGFTGRQKVLAVWNVADTGNAFYSCIDVNIGGGGDGGGDGEPGDCAPPAWNAGSVYTGGNTVSHEGHTWRAKWWVTGEEPGTSGEWGVWEDLGAC